MESKKFYLNNYLYSFYSTFIIVLAHYIFYIVKSLLIDGLNLSSALDALIGAGILFVASNFYSLYFLSILFTPFLIAVIKKSEKKGVSKKLLIINTLIAIPSAFLMLLVILIFHAAIGVSLAI